MRLGRRFLIAGTLGGVFYLLCLGWLMFAGGDTITIQPGDLRFGMVIDLCATLAGAFLLSATLFGLIPHYIEVAMNGSSSLLDLCNRVAVGVALVSVLIGVVAALLMIFDIEQAARPLLIAVTLFLGAIATMGSIKLFFYNRGYD